MANQENITVQPASRTEKGRPARLFPAAGALRCMEKLNADYTYMAVDGAQNCLEVLEDLRMAGCTTALLKCRCVPAAVWAGRSWKNSIVPQCEITRRWTV